MTILPFPVRDEPDLGDALLASLDIYDLAEAVMIAGHEITAAGDTIRIWSRPVPAALDELDNAIRSLIGHYATLKQMQARFGT